MRTTTSLVIALGLAAAPVAFAKKNADAPKDGKPDTAKAFTKKDTNGDGFLSKDEFTQGAKDAEKAGKAFDKKDKDGDGKLSPEEFGPQKKAGEGKKDGGKKKPKEN
jgi:Ca2+-binding EF-hand superfamily protein